MDLISREEVRQARPVWRNEEVKYETEEATIKAREFSRGWNDCLHEYIKNIKSLPSAFEGMTNGDVMKAIFPDCIDYHGIIEVKTHLDMGKTFRRSWWDSPYKGQDGLI